MTRPRIPTSTLLSEAFRNVTSHWALSLICGLIAFGGAYATVTGLVGAARDMTSVMEAQVELGSTAYVVTSPVGQHLSASSCEALRNVAGVKSAGARLDAYTVVPSHTPDSPVAVWEVTPGFVQFLFPDEAQTTAPGVVFGKLAAADVGAKPGAVINVGAARPRYWEVAGVSSLVTERVSGSAAVVVVPILKNSSINACFVEADLAHHESVGEVLVTWFGPASRWTVAPLLPPGRFEIDAPQALRAGPMVWIAPGLSLVAVLTAVSLWWSRRQEFALYGLLDFGTRELLSLLTLEWLATMVMPAVAGGLLALASLGPVHVHPYFQPTVTALVAVYCLVVAVAPALGYAAVRAISPINLLKGA